MSKNEKLTACVNGAEKETALQTKEPTTPQESDPLGKTSEETVNEVKEIIEEIKEEVAVKEEEAEKTTEGKETEIENTTETKTETEGEEAPKVHKIDPRKLGMLIAAGALCVFSVGAIGILGLSGNEIAVSDNEAGVYSAAEEDIVASVKSWNAGASIFSVDYDEEVTSPVVTSVTTEVEPEPETTTTTTAETTTTTAETTTVTTTTTKATTTKAPETTTTAKPTTTTKKEPEYTVEKIDEITFYLTDNVNIRKGAGTSYDKIATLKKGTAVTATHKCSNGWYKITSGKYTGYMIGDYFTDQKPVVTTTTTKATTTAKPVETTKPAETTAKPAETTAAKSENREKSDTPVIKYTDEELQMFYYVVEGEVGGCSEQSKLAVSNAIINRVKSSKFPNSLSGVLTQKSQFSAISNYYNKRRTPPASTKDCVNRALYGEDNSNGAVYFYSKKYCSASTARWFESLTFCLEVDGQRYFK